MVGDIDGLSSATPERYRSRAIECVSDLSRQKTMVDAHLAISCCCSFHWLACKFKSASIFSSSVWALLSSMTLFLAGAAVPGAARPIIGSILEALRALTGIFPET